MKWDAWKSAGSSDAGRTQQSAKDAYRRLIAEMVGTEGSAFSPIKVAPKGSAVAPPKPPVVSPSKKVPLQLPLPEEVRQALAKLESSAEVKLTEVKDVLERVQAELESSTENARARLNSNMQRIGFSFSFFSRDYLTRLLASLLFLVFTGYLNALSSNLAGYRNPQIKIIGPSWAKGTTTLPDLG